MNDEHQRDNNVYGPSASPQLSACISAACWALRLLSHYQARSSLIASTLDPYTTQPCLYSVQKRKSKAAVARHTTVGEGGGLLRMEAWNPA